MKKSFAAAITAAALLSSVGIQAFAEGTFLCMKADESVAISIDENNNFEYMDMRASNGELVYPQISTDGNTYLPFRYVCEMAGLKDGADIAGALPDGYFRYWAADPSIPGDKQKIELMVNGNYYCHNIGESFQYEVSPGDVRTVSIYNIRGSLYFPMTYMAKITDSQALWHGDTGRIMYISNTLNSSDFIDETGNLRRDKELYLNFDFYCNNLGGSPLYLKSDGYTISDLSAEIEGNPKVRSVTRNGRSIYFLDNNGRVNLKIEDNAEISLLSFADESGNAVDVIADTIISVQNKLYGVQVSAAGEKYGRLFSVNHDGSGFKYLNDSQVYNLIMREFRGNLYLFYCDATTRATLHMIELKTMDDYEIEITNFAHENLLSDIKQFVIGSKLVAYISNDGQLHVIDLEDNLEEFEIIRVNNENHKIFLTGSDGESLGNITSMNYDHINEVLYVTQVDYTGRTYYYTRSGDAFTRLERSDHPITDLALFSDAYYNDYCAKTVNGRPQIDRIRYSSGIVEIIN